MIATTLVSARWSSGFVNCRATHCVSCFGGLLVAFLGARAFTAVMCLPVATGPAVMTGFRACGRWDGLSGELCGQTGVFQECCDQFGVHTGEFASQDAVGGSERGDGLAIMGGCGGQICNGVYGVLLVDGSIGFVVGVASGVFAGVTKFAVRNYEIRFKLVPSSVGRVASFPNFAVLDEHASGVDELEGVVDDLLGAVRCESGGGVVNAIFDLVEECFNWHVGIVRCFEGDIVGLDV